MRRLIIISIALGVFWYLNHRSCRQPRGAQRRLHLNW